MSQIKDMIESLNIPADKLKELAQTLNQNPMSAMSLVQQLNIPPHILQSIMALIMSNPSSVKEFAKSLGVSDEALSTMENKLNPNKTETD